MAPGDTGKRNAEPKFDSRGRIDGRRQFRLNTRNLEVDSAHAALKLPCRYSGGDVVNQNNGAILGISGGCVWQIPHRRHIDANLCLDIGLHGADAIDINWVDRLGGAAEEAK